jgi:hypothetical protein
MAFSVPPTIAEPKTPQEIEQQYDREKNPRKRAELARDLMDLRLKELRSTVSEGTMIQESSAEVSDYMSALERLADAVRAADHTGTSKQTEMHLREHSRELENLRLNVSSQEGKVVERALALVNELREEVLYSIMIPEQESAKQ